MQPRNISLGCGWSPLESEGKSTPDDALQRVWPVEDAHNVSEIV
ncbi:MAG TPA: hypothetical protein PLU80_16175 [Acidobacteriota bacterium]|nr:hypothetical protein [Acidobacteriota bacterium]